jgi:TonB family protein
VIALLDVTIKVSLIVLVALAALQFLRARSAAARHWVLASAVACAAAVPLVGMAMPSWRIELPAGGAPAPTALPAASHENAAAIGVHSAAPLGAQAPSRAVRPAHVALALWLGGVGASLLVLMIGLWRLLRIEARATPTRRGRWSEIAAEVADRYGLGGPPRLLQTDHPALLVTWGLRQSRILLPAGAASWTDERIHVVLAHELAHVRRHDWIVQMGAEVLRSVYWFNPLLWIGCRRLRQECEQACDDAVLQLGVAGTVYAGHLLELARAFQAHRRVWLPAPAIVRPSSLERRVTAMLNAHTNRRAMTPRGAAANLVAFLVVTAAIAGFDAFAQARFATLSGTVVDQSGGVLANATIVLSNIQTNAKHEVRTNRTGYYEFVGLLAGNYELEVRQPAFQAMKEALSVGVGETLQRNVTLQIGAVQETITMVGGSDDAASRPRVETAPVPARKPCPSPEIGGCVGPPVKVKDVRPVYPQSLSDAGIEGSVLLEARIDSDGKTRDLRVVSSPHPALEGAAVDAVVQWEFAPTTLNGSAIDTPMNITVTFKPAAP